jgi:hypothetical protein
MMSRACLQHPHRLERRLPWTFVGLIVLLAAVMGTGPGTKAPDTPCPPTASTAVPADGRDAPGTFRGARREAPRSELGWTAARGSPAYRASECALYPRQKQPSMA